MDKDYWKILSLFLFVVFLLVAMNARNSQNKIRELKIENKQLRIQIDSLKTINTNQP